MWIFASKLSWRWDFPLVKSAVLSCCSPNGDHVCKLLIKIGKKILVIVQIQQRTCINILLNHSLALHVLNLIVVAASKHQGLLFQEITGISAEVKCNTKIFREFLADSCVDGWFTENCIRQHVNRPQVSGGFAGIGEFSCFFSGDWCALFRLIHFLGAASKDKRHCSGQKKC